MGLSEDQRTEVADLAELACRRHMNELFERGLPRIIQAAFTAHNKDGKAHAIQLAQHILTCPIAKKVDRITWLFIGLAFGAGLLGRNILQVLGLL